MIRVPRTRWANERCLASVAAEITLWCAFALFASCSATKSPSSAASVDSFSSRLRVRVANFSGDVGIYARNLTDGRTVEIRADELFPSASMIKVPILIGVFDALERKEFEYKKPLKWDAHRVNDEHDVLARFKDGVDIEPAELITFMCTFSDNTASLWLQDLAGGGAKINDGLSQNGFEKTRVNSRTKGREDARKEFGWGQTTAREMAEFLVRIRNRQVISSSSSEAMERALSRSYWTEEALAPIPPQVHAMSKQGAVNRSRSEVLLVDAPRGPYVLCVITKNQMDESWEHDNAGFQLLRDVSKLVYDEFGH